MNHVSFVLITGLRFGSFPAAPTKSALYKKVFGRYKTGIVFENIADELERYSEVEGEGKTTLKLAMLYTLVGILLCPSHSRKIDKKWIHLVDDLEKFNKHPWGRVVFDTLEFEVHECMRMRIKKRIDDKCELEKFDICGFVQALQVWAYETLPCCGGFCGQKVPGGLKLTPRLLRWKPKATSRFKELTTKCFPLLRPGDEGNGLMVLKLSYPKIRSDYYISVHRWIDELENAKNSGYGEEELENAKNTGHGEERRKNKMKGVVVEEWAGKETVERLVEQVAQQEQMLAEQKKMLVWLMGKIGYSVADYMANKSANPSPDSFANASPDPFAGAFPDPSAGASPDPSAGTSPDPHSVHCTDPHTPTPTAADLNPHTPNVVSDQNN